MRGRERRKATIPRTRNARTRAYISTVSHSLSSGKFIRANIRDAVKVTLFNVHPLRETSVHTPCAARPLSTPFQTTTRFFELEKRHVRPFSSSSSLFFSFFSIRRASNALNQHRGSSRNRREKTRMEGDREKLQRDGRRRGKTRGWKVGSNSRDGLLRRVVPREERPTHAQHPITVRINAIIRSARKGLRGHGMRVNVVINKSRSS